MKIANPRTLTTIDELRARKPKMILYGANTAWWIADVDLDRLNGKYDTGGDQGIPCDPRGGVLFQTDDIDGFLTAALSDPTHYGPHGAEAFILAYHGNVLTDEGKATCFEGWTTYSELLDAAQ